MHDLVKTLSPSPDLCGWETEFRQAGLDWVPDPMMLRSAELFVAGRHRCEKALGQDAARLWTAIEHNLDGVLAFFHALMTRERIPFIDYEMTYLPLVLQDKLESLALDVHPSGAYASIKQAALLQVAQFDFSRVDPSTTARIDDEKLCFGYKWEPSLGELEVDEAHRQIASFALGGLVFGAYAQASRSDHLLQSTRGNLFVDLAADGSLPPSRGLRKEGELFADLERLALRDPRFAVGREAAPPTVLHYLLARGVRNTEGMLEEALNLRAQSDWQRYRAWYRKLRQAWADGGHDPAAEAEVGAVVEELKRRIEGAPLHIATLKCNGELTAEARVGGDIGLAAAKAGAKGTIKIETKDLPVNVPHKLLNWFIDHLILSRHQKLLLEMSLDQRRFDDLAYGLRGAWMAS
ncbi:MAG: hypothetical protein JWO04_1801 [Gammaproteobacteria bacterium]|nr:hypothetical protein [Gammaproteobacteria bacterium]